jgi:hypothetical protein
VPVAGNISFPAILDSGSQENTILKVVTLTPKRPRATLQSLKLAELGSPRADAKTEKQLVHKPSRSRNPSWQNLY